MPCAQAAALLCGPLQCLQSRPPLSGRARLFMVVPEKQRKTSCFSPSAPDRQQEPGVPFPSQLPVTVQSGVTVGVIRHMSVAAGRICCFKLISSCFSQPPSVSGRCEETSGISVTYSKQIVRSLAVKDQSQSGGARAALTSVRLCTRRAQEGHYTDPVPKLCHLEFQMECWRNSEGLANSSY